MKSECVHCGDVFRRQYRKHVYCSIRCSNRAHLNHKNDVTLPARFSADLAELFGIILGDGSVAEYFVTIYLNFKVEKEYALFVARLAKKLFVGATVTVREQPHRGTVTVQISSVDVCRYLLSIGFDPKVRNIPTWIEKNKKYSIAVVRGLFDTEGTVGVKYYQGKRGKTFYNQLTVTNINQHILSFIERTLTDRGYKPTKRSLKNIYISNRLDIKRYLEDIGSHNPKMIQKLRVKEKNGFVYGGLRRVQG